jgi:hypothetical protein
MAFSGRTSERNARASSTKVTSASPARRNGKYPYRACTWSTMLTAVPLISTGGVSLARARRTAAAVCWPSSLAPSLTGRISTTAVLFRRQAGPVGITTPRMPSIRDTALATTFGLAPCDTYTSIGISTPVGMPPCSRSTTPARAGPC